MSYLDKLKKKIDKIPGVAHQQKQQKPPDPPSAGFAGTPGGDSASNFVTIEASGHWLIIAPPTEIERWFTPPIARTELKSRYPGAVLIPLPNTSRDRVGKRKLTTAELDELAKLIPFVAGHYGCPPEELAEIRTAAARAPSVALASFRAMARELGPRLDPIRPTSR